MSTVPTEAPVIRFVEGLLEDPFGAVAEWAATRPARTVAVILGALALLYAGRRGFRWLWWRDQQQRARLLVIRPPASVDPAAAVTLWRALTGMLAPVWKRWLCGQPPLAFEYRFNVNGARILLWVPGSVPPGLVEHAVTAAWPGAHIRPTSSQPEVAGTAVGGRLVPVRPECWPLATRQDIDPLRPLLEAASELRGEESVRAQILTRPVTGRRLRRLHAAAHSPARTRTGPVGVVVGALAGLMSEAIRLFLPGGTRSSATQHVAPTLVSADVRRPIREKAAQPQWETRITYMVATARRGSSARQRARGLAHEVAGAFAVHTGHNALRRRRLRRPLTALEDRRPRRGFLLSVAELAALAHLPFDENTPTVERAGARGVAPLPRIPSAGPDVKVLGDADTGPARPVALTVADACQHLHIQGATGSGKSTLLAHLINGDAAAGRGLLAIEPRGDLILDVLDRLPAAVADRVVLFDPDAPGARPALNVLAGPDPHAVTDNLVGIFRRIYSDYWGPRTDDIFRAACLTLHTSGHATLADIPELLTNPLRRTELTTSLADPVLAGFWTWFNGLSEPARAHAIAPLMNKLRAFLLRGFVRDTLCSTTDSVDIGRLLDHGGICLVRVPKGSLGTDTARLFGSLVLAKAWEAITHRARTLPGHRPPASIYLDEAHNFLTLPHGIGDMLAEARGYGLSLVLAHQDQAQLPPGLRESISANARNKIYFAVSPEDAASLHRHTHPQLTAHDLSHLDAYQAAARLIVSSAETPAFTFTTRPLPPPIPGRAEQIRARCSRNRPQSNRPSQRQPARDDPRLRTPAGVTPHPARGRRTSP